MPNSWDTIFTAVNESLPSFDERTLLKVRQQQIERIPAYLDMVFGELVKLFGSGVVEYLGHRFLSPPESIALDVEKPKYSALVDVTRSELALAQFTFSFEGQQFHTILYLPYLCEDAIIINGSRYYVMFPLVDRVFYHTTKDRGIGIKILKAHLKFWKGPRFTFKSVAGNVYGDNIILTKIHLKEYKYSAEDLLPALILYPLVKYGFKGTLTEYGISQDHMDICTSCDVTNSVYEYFCVREETELGSEDGLYLKVHKSLLKAELTDTAKLHLQIVASIRYCLQYFVKYKATIYTDNKALVEQYLHDPDNTVWKVILGKTIYGINYNEIQVASCTEQHISSLKIYFDPATKKKLLSIGVPNDDVYSLVYYVFHHIDEYIVNHVPSNIYKKQVNILDLLLGPIVQALFKRVYKLTNNRKPDRPYTFSEILRSLHIGPKVLTRIHMCTGVIATGTTTYNDNWLNGPGKRKERTTYATRKDKKSKDSGLIGSLLHRIHSSAAVVESLSHVQTSSPTIGGSINAFCPFTEEGYVDERPYMDAAKEADKYLLAK